MSLFVANRHVAPVLQFTRCDLEKRKLGQIFWAEDMCATDGLGYDTVAFGKWFEEIEAWIKKIGRRDPTDPSSAAFLPVAWKKQV